MEGKIHFLNHFATKRAWDLKNTKNDVFLARKRSRNFFDMGEGAIDSLDVCLSYEGYKSTFRQHWATLGGPKVGGIAKKHVFFSGPTCPESEYGQEYVIKCFRICFGIISTCTKPIIIIV